MPTQSGIVGPVPEGEDPEEYDKRRRRVLWAMPYGLYVIGTRHEDRRNAMTLNWVTQLSFEPKLIGVSIERAAFTHELLEAGRVFSLCLLDREDKAIVRRFTKPVEVDLEARTLNGHAFHDGRSGAPVLDEAAAFVDCELRQQVELQGHTLFMGEVIDAGFQKPEDTLILRMEDTRMNYGG